MKYLEKLKKLCRKSVIFQDLEIFANFCYYFKIIRFWRDIGTKYIGLELSKLIKISFFIISYSKIIIL